MSNRYADWLRQAEADLRHARKDGDHEWSCFAAQQAAEKALKAVVQANGGEAWGHSVTVLAGELSGRMELPDGLHDAARRLDKHYIPTRCPNGFDAGAPTDYYTGPEAEAAIRDADTILEFARGAVG